MISKVLDDYILDKDEPFWYVLLNTGDYVYQDDNRAGFTPSAWERLCSYCKIHGCYIEKMWIRFRSNIVEIPSGKDAYWFKKGLLAGFSKETGRRFKDTNFFIIGYPENNVFKVVKWRIPELVDWEHEYRAAPKEGVIWKNDARKE